MPKVSSISKTITARSRDFDLKLGELRIERNFLGRIAHVFAQNSDDFFCDIVHGRLPAPVYKRAKVKVIGAAALRCGAWRTR